jgi:DNA-binding response OmpR family regulator
MGNIGLKRFLMTNTDKNKTGSILIVDDEPHNIQMLGITLKENGYESEFATNGEEALEWCARRFFDLLLLDIMMPGIDGFEVCNRLKNNPATKGASVIFITGKNDTESIVKGFDAGAVDYITKPFNKFELLARVKTHLELTQSRRELARKIKELAESETTYRQLFDHASSGVAVYEAVTAGENFIIRDFNTTANLLCHKIWPT